MAEIKAGFAKDSSMHGKNAPTSGENAFIFTRKSTYF
jgi:hypothetical protein